MKWKKRAKIGVIFFLIRHIAHTYLMKYVLLIKAKSSDETIIPDVNLLSKNFYFQSKPTLSAIKTFIRTLKSKILE